MGYLIHFPQTTSLEFEVAYCEHFVNYQYLGFEMRGHCKSQPNVHTRRITLDGHIEKFLHLSEGNYLIELPLYFFATHSKNCAVQKDILAAGQLRMKTGAYLEQARDSATDSHPASRRLGYAAQYFEQRGFAGAVAPDDANNFSLADFERNVF
jgi:hypothetical protein